MSNFILKNPYINTLLGVLGVLPPCCASSRRLLSSLVRFFFLSLSVFFTGSILNDFLIFLNI